MVEKNAAEIEAMRETLRKAAETGPPTRNQPRSKAEKIRMLRSEIAVLRTKGWKWEEVALALADQLDASADTIRLAIGGTKKRPSAKRALSVEKTKPQSVVKRSAAEADPKIEPEAARARTAAGPQTDAAAKTQLNRDKQFGARKL